MTLNSINVFTPEYRISETKPLVSIESCKPGHFQRRFLEIPSTITSAVVRVKSLEEQETGSYVLHTLQLTPHISNRTDEFQKFFSLSAQAEINHVIPLKSGRTVEVCFGKWWSSFGESKVQLSIEFHGLQPSLNSFTMVTELRLFGQLLIGFVLSFRWRVKAFPALISNQTMDTKRYYLLLHSSY